MKKTMYLVQVRINNIFGKAFTLDEEAMLILLKQLSTKRSSALLIEKFEIDVPDVEIDKFSPCINCPTPDLCEDANVCDNAMLAAH